MAPIEDTWSLHGIPGEDSVVELPNENDPIVVPKALIGHAAYIAIVTVARNKFDISRMSVKPHQKWKIEEEDTYQIVS